MFDLLKQKLDALDCAAWELTETRERRWEFYFIRHRMDQNRVAEVTTDTVRVYRSLEDGKYLGSASGEISPTATEAEIDKALGDLLFQAGLVKNPAYTLTDVAVTVPPRTEPVDIEAIAEQFLKTVRAVPETETEDINSYELFVNEVTRRTLNSNGVAYECTYPSSMLEVVVNARREGHEIELYRNFTSGACGAEKLQNDIADAMRFGRDRLSAEPTPKLEDIDVVFSTQDAVALYEYFADRCSAAFKYRRLSDWEPGQSVGAGDTLEIEALPELENSSRNFPVDEEGSVIAPRFLIRGGKAENFWGGRQFSQYLGLENSSIVHNFRAGGGTEDASALRSGDYLELVEFSDFQVDSIGGDVAGEIRLGYLHRGGETKIVTGGSVSGNMRDSAPTMRFSRESAQYDTWVIPAVTRLKKLRITGIA